MEPWVETWAKTCGPIPGSILTHTDQTPPPAPEEWADRLVHLFGPRRRAQRQQGPELRDGSGLCSSHRPWPWPETREFGPARKKGKPRTGVILSVSRGYQSQKMGLFLFSPSLRGWL